MISDERFFAWLDGELDPAEAAAIGALVAADPALQRRAEAHRALGGGLRAAFDPIAEAPLPARLLEAAGPREAEVVDFGTARDRRLASYPVWTQYAAMAATLAIGIVAGSMIDSSASSPIASENGQLVASGDLEQALYARLASAPADEGARIGLTFRDAVGDLCRSFTDDGAAGLACHQRGDWRIRGLFQAGEGQQAEFRMAAGPDPRLAELIDATMAGEPLDASAERKALDSLR
jgi:hypothetical protein